MVETKQCGLLLLAVDDTSWYGLLLSLVETGCCGSLPAVIITFLNGLLLLVVG
jgi:hypothetical protein